MIYNWGMSETLTTVEQIGDVLRSVELHAEVQACEYLVRYEEEYQTEAVVVVLIFGFEEWNDDASLACEESSNAVWDALAKLGVMVETICRTKDEHESARIDDGSWHRIDSNVSC